MLRPPSCPCSARWPPERDRDEGKKVVWVPNSRAGALHQIDGRDRTFNNFGQEQIGLQVGRVGSAS